MSISLDCLIRHCCCSKSAVIWKKNRNGNVSFLFDVIHELIFSKKGSYARNFFFQKCPQWAPICFLTNMRFNVLTFNFEKYFCLYDSVGIMNWFSKTFSFSEKKHIPVNRAIEFWATFSSKIIFFIFLFFQGKSPWSQLIVSFEMKL